MTGWRALCASCRYDTVAVAPLRLPQVHPYTIGTYLLVRSSETPNRVPTRLGGSSHSASLLPAESRRVTPKCAYQLRKSGNKRLAPTASVDRMAFVEQFIDLPQRPLACSRIDRRTAAMRRSSASMVSRFAHRSKPRAAQHPDRAGESKRFLVASSGGRPLRESCGPAAKSSLPWSCRS